MKISVIVTVLNEGRTIEALLAALAQQTKKPDEVVIVDGGSTDQTWAKLIAASQTSKKFPLRVFQQSGNRSLGRNYAIEQATYDWLAITDAGCVPQGGWLAALAAAAQKNHASVVAGYYDAQATTAFQEAVIPYFLVMPDRVDPETFLPATRSMMLHRSAWQGAGRFDEQLGDNEDYALAQQLQKFGRRQQKKLITFTDAAKVTWLPPTTFLKFIYTIFRFARGDAQSGLWRPKVGLIFGRYLVALMMIVGLLTWATPALTLAVSAVGLLLYASWSIIKNLRYVPHGWYWLPVLQITSDLAVMAGSLAGLFFSLQPRPTSV